RTQHRLQHKPEMLNHPLQQLATVDAVHPDAPQPLAGAQAPQPPQYQPGTSRVGHTGSSYYYRHQQSQCVHHDMALTSHNLLVAVVPAFSRYVRAFDALAVHTSGCSLLVSPRPGFRHTEEHLWSRISGPRL